MNKLLLTFGMSLALSVPLAQAGVQDDYSELYEKARSTHQEAGNFQWTTTTDRLNAAKSAAESGDYEQAASLAKRALKLAEESVAQRNQQHEAWRNAAIGN